MKNKKCLFLIIALLFVATFTINPVEAKRHTDKDQAQRQSETAGVQGNEGDVLKQVNEDKDIFACRKSMDTSCSEKYKTVINLFSEIKREKKSYCNSLNKKSFKGDPNQKLVKEVVKLRDDKKKVKDFECKCSSFVDSMASSDIAEIKSIVAKQIEIKEVADSLAKEAKDYKNDNQDQVDVEPMESGCLNDGDLVAWGIPSIPHIPTSRPKTTTSSSSSSQKAEPKPVTDEGYKALRSVEIESGKVTDTEKDQFIVELDSRVGSN